MLQFTLKPFWFSKKISNLPHWLTINFQPTGGRVAGDNRRGAADGVGLRAVLRPHHQVHRPGHIVRGTFEAHQQTGQRTAVGAHRLAGLKFRLRGIFLHGGN